MPRPRGGGGQGLGLGLGLNRQQQNRFAQAAQQPGGGSQWLGAHPNVARRVNQVNPNSQQATNIGNFVGAGQMAPNAARRFQPLQPGAPGGGPAQGAPQGGGGAKAGGQGGGGGMESRTGMGPGGMGGGQPGGGAGYGGQMSGPGWTSGTGAGQQGGVQQQPQLGQPGFVQNVAAGAQQPQQGGYNPLMQTATMQPMSPAQQAAMAAYQGSPAQQMAQANARNPQFMANAWNQAQPGQLGGMQNVLGQMGGVMQGMPQQQQQNLMQMIQRAFAGGGGQGF